MSLILDDQTTAAKEPPESSGKWTLKGLDAFADEYYDLDGEYDTEAEAIEAGKLRLEELEETQPSESSGGQSMMGIQDRVYVVSPSGHPTRI